MSLFTKSSEVTAEIYRRLQGVLVANGAETDIGQRVYRGRRPTEVRASVPGAEVDYPYVTIIEGAASVTDQPGKIPQVKTRQRYMLVACLACDPDNPNDAANAAIRDIKRALFTNDKPAHPGQHGGFNGRVSTLAYRSKAIDPKATGADVVFASVEIDVDFVESLIDP